jgi:Ca2+-binding RTX toxin-like protein
LAGIVSATMRWASRSIVGLAVLLLAMVGLAVPAAATVSCSFTAPTVTVTAEAGDSVVIVRTGSAIHVNGAPCDTAAVTTTDTIAVDTTGVVSSVTIDLSGGPFEPGTTAGGEIKFTVNVPNGAPVLKVIGSSGPDHVVAGAGGINLNANEATPDKDVTITGSPAIELEGGDGDDVLSIGGGGDTGNAIRGVLRGGAGNDRLLAGASGSTVDGGEGIDTVDYAAASALEEANLATGQVTHAAGGTDTLTSIESFVGSPGDDRIVGTEGDDTIDGGDGEDTIDYSASTSAVDVNLRGNSATGQGTDILRNIENVIGSPGDDRITGNDEANVLDGGPGNDTIDGGDGDDELIGGAGEDTVSFRSSSSGVTADLKKGTAEGAGKDSLSGFEHVVGSPKADEISGDGKANRLEGLGGNDSIFGRAGDDRIFGGNGNDRLFGQGGDDVLRGEKGKDQHNGGRGKDHCKGGPGADSFVLCENFPT